MSISSQVSALQRKHEHLSNVVEAAQRQPAADDLEIAALKKQTLRLKEEIARLTQWVLCGWRGRLGPPRQ